MNCYLCGGGLARYMEPEGICDDCLHANSDGGSRRAGTEPAPPPADEIKTLTFSPLPSSSYVQPPSFGDVGAHTKTTRTAR